jgi:serine/threonine-protein kinase
MSEKPTLVEVDARHPQSKPSKRMIVRDDIDEGGMSFIREAFDTNLLRSAAMKVVRPELLKNEVILRQFVEEAQITAQLDHPNIVPVHELGVDKKGSLFFTMKLVRGMTLNALLARKNLKDRTESELFQQIQVFLKVCDALSFAHSRGVLHQDLKPENIMVGEHGAVYLMDWGIARLLKKERPSAREKDLPTLKGKRYTASSEGIIMGTPFYMSPERATGDTEAIDERTDVFSLGGILYEILTLTPPYLGKSTKELVAKAREGKVVPPQDFVDRPLPARLCRIAMKAMSTKPEDRYQSVIELKLEVEKFLQSGWQYPRKLYPPGSLIVCEGDEGDDAYIITRGKCRVFKTVDGRKVTLREMGRGEVFGETAVLTSKPRAASVEAIDLVTVAVVTGKYFKEEMGMQYWMGMFMKALAERFREKDEQVTELERHLDQRELTKLILHHLLVAGTDDEGGKRETRWSSLQTILGEKSGRSQENILSLIEESGMFSIDAARDVLTLSDLS